MGLVASKIGNTPLINLCKERKALIRAARDARHYLATAHVLYFQSLAEFGNALNQFVQNELIVIPISSDDDDLSAESSLSDYDSDDSDSLLASSTNSACKRSEASACCRASACNHRGSEDRRCLSRNNVFAPVMKQDDLMRNPQNFGHTCESSNNARDRWQEETYNSDEGIRKSKGGSEIANNDFVSATTEMSSGNVFFGEKRNAAENSSSSASPPRPSVPTWDFLDVFNVTDYVNYHYLNGDEDEGEDGRWRKVREKEGIPDLEDESEVSPVVELKQKRNPRGKVKKGSSNNSTVVTTKADLKDTENNFVCFERDKEKSVVASALAGIENASAASVSRGSMSLSTDEDNTSGSLCSHMHESSSKDLGHIVNQISNLFETTVRNGGKVSELLEVDRLPHQPFGTQFKDFASRILGSTNLTHKHLNHSNSSSRALQTHDRTQRTGEEKLMLKSSFLSATLDKLYIWETKLLREVMEEEKLRVLYDKEFKILKNLDCRGAEPSEIGATETSVKGLLSKINVSLRAVESISGRVHKIRDEEMLFQLLEIIHELTEMWEILAKCHHQQFWEIARSRSCVHIVESDGQKKPSLKATQKLRAEITRYEASFTNYISAQRAFVRVLKEWLVRNILNEQDNGNPTVSPTTVGAPEIFRLCNQWWDEIEKVSETKVCSAIQDLTSRLCNVETMQTEEVQLRIRTKQLQKELAKQAKNLQEVWGVALPLSDSAEKMIIQLGGVGQDLLSLRETIAQEKAKHEKVVQELNDTVSVSMQEGLVSIFEALEEFCLRNVKAYQNIKISTTQ